MTKPYEIETVEADGKTSVLITLLDSAADHAQVSLLYHSILRGSELEVALFKKQTGPLLVGAPVEFGPFDLRRDEIRLVNVRLFRLVNVSEFIDDKPIYRRQASGGAAAADPKGVSHPQPAADPPQPHYLRLDDPEFRRLVAGKTLVMKTVHGDDINVILADIGWDRMLAAIEDAQAGKTP